MAPDSPAATQQVAPQEALQQQEREQEESEPWTVALTEQTQVERTTEEVIAMYAAGEIDAQTYVWKSTMDDWATIFEIEELSQELRQRGLTSGWKEARVGAAAHGTQSDQRADAPEFQASQSVEWREPGSWGGGGPEGQAYDDVTLAISQEEANALAQASTKTDEVRLDDVTHVGLPHGALQEPEAMVSPGAAAVPESGPPPSPAPAPRTFAAAASAAQPARVASTPTPAAPSAADQAPAPPVDLFGKIAEAGSESEVLAAPTSENQPVATGQRVGARNENSVLFSLDALVKNQSKPPPVAARQEQRSDVDILLGPPPEQRPPDSLRNLSAGGLFSGGLTSADYGDAILQAAPGKSWGDRILAFLLVIVLLAGVVAVLYIIRPEWFPNFGGPDQVAQLQVDQTGNTAVATLEADRRPADIAQERPEPTPTASSSAAPQPVDSGQKETAPKAKHPEQEPKQLAERDHTATKNPPAPYPTLEEKPTSVEEPVEQQPANDEQQEPASKTPDPPFNRAAASQALGQAAASVASCKTEGGPTGSGRVTVTFAPSGRATVANVTGAFAGTKVGGCVARLFRKARVPAFSGDATTVAKSFKIQ